MQGAAAEASSDEDADMDDDAADALDAELADAEEPAPKRKRPAQVACLRESEPT